MTNLNRYNSTKTTKFSIRKFKVGVASAVIAAFWLASCPIMAEQIEADVEAFGDTVVQSTELVETSDTDFAIVGFTGEEEQTLDETVVEEEVQATSEEIEEISDISETVETDQAEEMTETKEETKEAKAEETVENEKEKEITKAGSETKSELNEVQSPVRVASATYRVQYADVETGQVIYSRNYRVSEEVPAVQEGPKDLSIELKLDFEQAQALKGYELADEQELTIRDNVLQSIVTENEKNRRFTIYVRRDEISGAEDEGEESYTVLNAAKDYTAQDIVKWAVGRLGQYSNYAGSGGSSEWNGQCVALIRLLADEKFSGEWNSYAPSGLAAEYINANIPQNWQRIRYSAGFIPQPGDIAIWGYNYAPGFGHVAIVIEANSSHISVIDQNGVLNNGRGTVAKHNNIGYGNFLGVLRPNYKKTTSSSSTSTVTRYDASKYAKENIANGEYVIHVAGKSDLKLETTNVNKADAANVRVANSSQTWLVEHVGSGYYKIINKQTGKSLDSTSTSPGANVNQYTYKGGKNHQWVFKPSADGKSYEIINAHSGLVLDIQGGKLNQGTNVQMYTANNGGGQKFQLTRKDTTTAEAAKVGRSLADGEYYISVASDPKLRLDVTDRNKANGTNIRIWQNTQSYQVTYLGNGYYKIINKQVGTSLDSASDKIGANIISYAYHGGLNQQWIIKPTSDGYYEIVNRHSGLAVDVQNAQIKQGTNVHMWNRKNNGAQKFRFDPVMTDTDAANIGRTLADGEYFISSSYDPKYRLDVTDRNKKDGTNIRIWQNTQTYNLTYLGNGYYKIINKQVGTSLATESTATGSNVVSKTYTGAHQQQWTIRPTGDGKSYHIINRHSGLVLDIQGGKVEQGTNVFSYVRHTGVWQKFQFDRVITESDVAKIGKTIEDGDYYISSYLDPKLRVDITDRNKANGTNIRIWQNTQSYKVSYLGNGYYKIINNQVGTALTAATVHTGANVVSNAFTGGHQQQWAIRPTADGKSYEIINRHSGLVLDIQGGKISQGTNLQMWVSNNGGAQKFRFDRVINDSDVAKIGKTIEDGEYIIAAAIDPKLRLDVTDRSKQEGTNIRIWQNTQTYKVTYLGNGYYKLINSQVGTSLAIESIATGSNVVSKAYTGAHQQQWAIRPTSDGNSYEIINRHSGLVLDIQGGKVEQGTNIFSYVSHGGDWQKFVFENVTTSSLAAKVGKTLEDGEYYIGSALNPKVRLDVAGASKSNGTNVRVWENTQSYQVNYLGNGFYKIINKQTGTVLDTASRVRSGNVISNTYSGTASQQWIIKPTSDGKSYEIINRQSGLVLDIAGGSISQGTNVHLWNSNNTGAQKFYFESIAKSAAAAKVGRTLEDGEYYIGSALNPKVRLDVAGADKSTGTNVRVWENKQTYQINYLGNGYYKIVNKETGTALDTVSGVRSGNVVSNTYTGTASQQWIIKPTSDGKSYEIINRQSGLVLDIAGGNVSQGTNVHMWNSNNTGAQKFYFESIAKSAAAAKVGKTLEDGEYYIGSVLNPKIRLDVAGASKSNGTNVRVWENKQTYQINYLGNGYYKIINKETGTALDTVSSVRSGNVVSNAYSGTASQQWIIKPTNDGKSYEIINRQSGLVLDIAGGSISQGTNVHMWNSNNTEAQKFRFNRISGK